MRLEDWSIGYDPGDGYAAPELCPRVLRGVVFGHPRLADGRKISTSPIVKAEGRLVTTRSGSVYELGLPSSAYLAYVASLGRTIDYDQPIKVVRDA